jgi:ABC-type Fe3+-siderophore transport system permease subunit
MDEISVSMIVVTLWETFGGLSVIAAIVGVLLFFMLVAAFARTRARGLPAGRLLLQGVVIMLVLAAVITPFVPVWTLAGVSDLRGLVDYVFAYSIALAPAAICGVFWIYTRSWFMVSAGFTRVKQSALRINH